ncbi:PepSY domain-containing protein [Psychrobium sp. 1_MG-2023]|uniref:PepSY-associated TM helix domain-containing protein n=1 Tax=Psychrobium sp. 1_MG-2023 TaxID=3062624 RepID=UPI000C3462CD|nr:PepSY domain-containing protein [Psychrobium sp. 1_MG-2023]MDP2561104.1 PepSY domain-containing protein [Psychrobium sp. 1_MG-2023]PKF58392.1 PepSY domain-containing protein [Alteromonadales bacterium alter-6D02]
MVSIQLNRWLWKWHVIAGLLSLPFIILLTITGVIYLFKADVNNWTYQEIKFVEAKIGNPHSIARQAEAVKAYTSAPITKFTLPQHSNEATQFYIKSKGRPAHIVYVNPYTAQVTGDIKQTDTFMYTVRKLHGELLLNTPGTLLVELVASWFIVLLITGLIIWFPFKNFSAKRLVEIRTQRSKRIVWRDIHGVFSFWTSLVLLMIIAGAMPWTDVFGNQLKWVQKQTDSGYPAQWRKTDSLQSVKAIERLSLDAMAQVAQAQQLPGKVTVTLPKTDLGVFSVSNRSLWLSDQEVIHLDQYSGIVVKQLDWSHVGMLMDLRQIFMRLHQGEYGSANWWIVLISCAIFLIASVGSIVSYFMRRPQGQWGIPNAPKSFSISWWVLGAIAAFAVLFPLFGLSVVLILTVQGLRTLVIEHRNQVV